MSCTPILIPASTKPVTVLVLNSQEKKMPVIMKAITLGNTPSPINNVANILAIIESITAMIQTPIVAPSMFKILALIFMGIAVKIKRTKKAIRITKISIFNLI